MLVTARWVKNQWKLQMTNFYSLDTIKHLLCVYYRPRYEYLFDDHSPHMHLV